MGYHQHFSSRCAQILSLTRPVSLSACRIRIRSASLKDKLKTELVTEKKASATEKKNYGSDAMRVFFNT